MAQQNAAIAGRASAQAQIMNGQTATLVAATPRFAIETPVEPRGDH
jgi:hypothetical protein